MPLHKELFTDLPPAEGMRRDIAGNLAQKYNADGYYILAQLIAEKYGDQAYTLAEEVFKEMAWNMTRRRCARPTWCAASIITLPAPTFIT